MEINKIRERGTDGKGSRESIPYVSRLHLCVPTVACVMCHLVRHVLTEAELCLVDTNLHKKLIDPTHEVRQRLIGYKTLQSEHSKSKSM